MAYTKHTQVIETRPITQDDIDCYEKFGFLHDNYYRVRIPISRDGPALGDLIARNPKDHSDTWLICACDAEDLSPASSSYTLLKAICARTNGADLQLTTTSSHGSLVLSMHGRICCVERWTASRREYMEVCREKAAESVIAALLNAVAG